MRRLALVLLAPILAAPILAAPASAQPELWEVTGDRWRRGLSGAVVQGGRLTLPEGARRGQVQQLVAAQAPFDRLVVSLNPEPLPAGARVLVRVRVRAQGRPWSAWLPLGVYGRGGGLPRSETGSVAEAKVDVDVVRCARLASEAEVRLDLEAPPQSAPPRIRRLAVSLWRAGPARPPAVSEREAWGRVLDVPQRSQALLEPHLAPRACSPTSLAMVLAHHGLERATPEVAAAVYDHAAAIYGNWSFNVAHAAELGLEATAARLAGLADLEAEVLAGRPVIVSHRYGPGELTGSPIGATDGHLLVVVGFTAEGDVVVNDPAADPRQGEAVRRVYRRDELRRAWLERAEGVAYLLRPRPAR